MRDGDPDFARKLGPNLVDAQCGQQTHDGLRDPRADGRERVVLSRFCAPEPVQALRDPLDCTVIDQLPQVAERQVQSLEITRTKERIRADLPEPGRSQQVLCHALMIPNVGRH